MQRPSFCQYCGKRFPTLHQYNNCDECGQPIAQLQAPAPIGLRLSDQPLESSTAGGRSALTIFSRGLVSIIAIALITFIAIYIFSDGASKTSEISLPTAQFIGMDINGNPAKVNYLILRVTNPSSREAFPISAADLRILYQDGCGNVEEVSYPGIGTGVGLIADARDRESIDSCSELASQPDNVAIWCFINDGFNRTVLPGMTGDIYIFLGGLKIPLTENIGFSVDLVTLASDVVITAKGTTPGVFALPTIADTPTPIPTPTVQVVVTPIETPVAPAAVPVQPPPALPAISPPPALPAISPEAPTPTAPAPNEPTPTTPAPAPDVQPVVLQPLPSMNSRVTPHALVGVARINGEPATTGTKVTAWVDGYDSPLATSEVTVGGSFTLTIPQYESILTSGQTSISFKIGDKIVPQTNKWISGNVDEFNLSIN